MKTKMMSTFLLLMTLAATAYANGGAYPSGVKESAWQEEEFSIEQQAQEKAPSTERTRERMEDNPRNPAMVDSFEKVETEEERKEKRK